MTDLVPPDPSAPDSFAARVNEIIDGRLSDPLGFPAAFRAWIPQYIEMNPPLLPISQIIGFSEHDAYPLLLSGLGALSESAPFANLAHNALQSNWIYGSSIGLWKGAVVTNIIVGVQTAAVAPAATLVKLGLADFNGRMLASTGNLNNDAGLTSTGFFVAPLSSPFTATYSGVYIPVILQVNNFVTDPQYTNMSVFGFSANLPKLGSHPSRFAVYGKVQTDLPAVGASLPAASSVPVNLWFGLS